MDTLKVAKKYFRFSSNKLDELGNYLQEGRKESTGGFETWLGCRRGDKKSWNKMKTYNARDVVLLENVYLRLRPFIRDHVSMFKGNEVCTVCGSKDIQSRGYRMTKVGRYKRYHCQSCSSWTSGVYERNKKGESMTEDDES